MLEEKTSRSSFAWGAAAGLTAGLAANLVRKAFIQAPTALAGDWDDALTAEHRATLAIFDLMEKTEDSHAVRRSVLLTQLKHALAKHAMQEEDVIYAAMRTHGMVEQADHLNNDHGYVKQYLFELSNMAADHPQWRSKVGDFRAMIEQHMREEEEELFPRLRRHLAGHEVGELTKAMNLEGLKIA